ncbi:MAG: hypothetical protein ABI142_02080, partial [Bryocella sp.]
MNPKQTIHSSPALRGITSLLSPLRPSSLRLSRTACLALLLTTALPLALAQSASPTTTLHVNARLVVLDVVVTDKQGRTVDDLTRGDFQIYEDNKLQEMRSFESPSAHQPALSPANNTTEALTQTLDPARPAAFGVMPVTVLVFDQLNTHFADSAFARGQLHNYLAAQPRYLALPTELF